MKIFEPVIKMKCPRDGTILEKYEYGDGIKIWGCLWCHYVLER